MDFSPWVASHLWKDHDKDTEDSHESHTHRLNVEYLLQFMNQYLSIIIDFKSCSSLYWGIQETKIYAAGVFIAPL